MTPSFSHLLSSVVLVCSASGLFAATPLPVWNGQPGSTRQGYEFTSGDTTPDASPLINSFGSVSAVVTTGSFSDGWQDPGEPIDLSGANVDGAWDLGVAGTISASVPVIPSSPAPGFYYRVDFHVNVVAYRGITSLPSFTNSGFTAMGLTMTTGTVAVDPLFPGASWDYRSWTGYFDTVSPAAVQFGVAAPANNSSVVDSFEVFTRYTLIPEPGSCTLIGIGLLLGSRRRRP